MMYLFFLLFHSQVVSLSGAAQGTTWQVRYTGIPHPQLQSAIDSTLQEIDQCLSLYRNDSEISLFNKSTTWTYELPYFYPVLKKSAEIYTATHGAFDPTVMPLTAAYRAGKKSGQPWWEKKDSLLQYVGFTKIVFDENKVHKLQEQVRLDFDGIAQGYSVDVLATLLERNGISDYMVEIGGEVRCKGRKNGIPWSIGIDNPLHPEAEASTVQLFNKAATTAGNYRDYYQQDGHTFGHIINPATGATAPADLLSVTVFADDAITADGYDTAFMVMGLEATKRFLLQHKELDAYLVYKGDDGQLKVFVTEGIKPFIKGLP
ncbi:MAG: FAD:protein FMN transferase [Chitinophaga sp.]|uniref:FAD:protein FMN transferase n=1 Tax=Chitinophaga sp. TaxID=1869181 RepID=UPI001B2E7A92|nr:FAD:protein FMN transferase [Chitinophaga sp.]MBO9727329.1 FAD:protein FMN transferase [Chitinophaga sp.]